MLLPGLVAFAVATLLTPLLAAWARRRDLLDIPNERSSHQIATPRIGGAAFVLAFLSGVGTALFFGDGLATTALSVLGAACGLSLLGLLDDVRPLPALLRLMIQIGISLWLVRAAGTLLPGGIPTPVAVALAALWMTAATNAFNFMDGIDGIAASQAIAAGAGWAIVGRLVGSPDLTLLGMLAASVAVWGLRALGKPRARPLRLLPALRLAALVTIDVTRSNLEVAALVLRPKARKHRAGFVDHVLQ